MHGNEFGVCKFLPLPGHISFGFSFPLYLRGDSYARVLAVVVCLSVTRRFCVKTAKRSITRTTPSDSPETLVFWRQQ